jgi:hypothetical protein
MPKREQISVRGDTYAQLKAEAERRGVSVTAVVEEFLGSRLSCCPEPIPVRALNGSDYCMSCRKRVIVV